VSDEPQPEWVAAEMTDAHGRTWTFFDKYVIFTRELVTSATPLPVDGVL